MKKKQEVKGSFFENLKLRQKMSLIIGSVTFVILASLLYFLLHSFRLSMNKRVDANMADKAAQSSIDLDDLVGKLNASARNIERASALSLNKMMRLAVFRETHGEFVILKARIRPFLLWTILPSVAVWWTASFLLPVIMQRWLF